MSDEPINANPTVKDTSQLPTRETKTTLRTFPHEQYEAGLDSLVTQYLFDCDNEDQRDDEDNGPDEPLDAQEIYDLIASISDPEHPLSLGQLSVVNLPDISVQQPNLEKGELGHVCVQITPTITHCSLATLIGLGIRVRLDRSVSKKYRPQIIVKEGTHQSEKQVNKQLNDKERVCAACENPQLVKVVSQMLSTCIV